MAVIIKTNHAEITSLGQCLITVRPYDGADPETGEDAYLWVCHTEGGEGLAMRGRIRELLKHGRQLELRIDIIEKNRSALSPTIHLSRTETAATIRF